MKNAFLIAAACLGLSAVALGALGAHWLKAHVSPAQLEGFDTAVRYQMYHAVVLLSIALAFDMNSSLERATGWLMLIGVILFSGSIYLLSTASIWKWDMRFLGPITPLGGLLMIAGWTSMLIIFIKKALK